MSKYLDDSALASQPGNVHLSLDKLRALSPDLLGAGTFKCGDLCDEDHPAAEMRDRIDDALMHGNASPALVVSIAPLVVAVYTTDLDAAVLLSFPPEAGLVERHALSVGSQLLAISTFTDLHDRTGARLYAADLVPGPKRVHWSNFVPLVADFLTDDADALARGKELLAPEEWELVRDRARLRVERLGLDLTRDGRPTTCGVPAIAHDGARYRRLDGLAGLPHFPGDEWRPIAQLVSSRWTPVLGTVLLAVLVAWLRRC